MPGLNVNFKCRACDKSVSVSTHSLTDPFLQMLLLPGLCIACHDMRISEELKRYMDMGVVEYSVVST